MASLHELMDLGLEVAVADSGPSGALAALGAVSLGAAALGVVTACLDLSPDGGLRYWVKAAGLPKDYDDEGAVVVDPEFLQTLDTPHINALYRALEDFKYTVPGWKSAHREQAEAEAQDALGMVWGEMTERSGR